MRGAAAAIAWEVWARRRVGWVIVAGAAVALAVVCRYFFWRVGEDAREMMTHFPMAVGAAAVFGLVNYAQEEGFPRRLFVRPVRTWVLVSCPLAYGVIAVVGAYASWMAGVAGRWPTTLVVVVLGAAVVNFQAMVWVLARRRLLRIAVMTGVAVELVTVACLPWTLGRSAGWAVETWVVWGLVAQGMAAYAVAIAYVGRERTGGHVRRRKAVVRSARKRDAAPFASAARALDWMEWRRGGMMLPVGCVAGALAVLAVGWIAGHGRWEEGVTGMMLGWLCVLPVLMGGMVGTAIGRPDAWSMEGRVPGVIAMRPVTCGEVVAAKMRVAAWGTAVAWGATIAIAGAWIAWGAERTSVAAAWDMARMIWGGGGRVGVLAMALVCGVVGTYGLMVSGLWAGMSRRTWPGVVWVLLMMGLFAGAIVVGAVVSDDPGGLSRLALWALPGVPWVLAGLVGVKMWLAVVAMGAARRSGLVTDRFVVWCVVVWAVGTACVVGYACAMSPAVGWVRGVMWLAAPLVVPLARVGAAPVALADNRHR